MTIVNEDSLSESVDITVDGTTYNIKYFIESARLNHVKIIPLLTTSHGCYRYDEGSDKLILTISPITKSNNEMIYPVLNGDIGMYIVAFDSDATTGALSNLGGNTVRTAVPLKYCYIRYSDDSVYLCKNTGTYNAPLLSPISNINNDPVLSPVSSIITSIYGSIQTCASPTNNSYILLPCMIIEIDDYSTCLSWINARTITYDINNAASAKISTSASVIPYTITDTKVDDNETTTMYEVSTIPISMLLSGSFEDKDIIKETTNKRITNIENNENVEMIGRTYPNVVRDCISSQIYIIHDVKSRHASHNFYYCVGEKFIYSAPPGNEYAVSIIPADKSVSQYTEQTVPLPPNGILGTLSASALTTYEGNIEADFVKNGFNIHDFKMHNPYNLELVDYYGYRCSGLSVFATDTGLYTISLYDEDTDPWTGDKLTDKFPRPSTYSNYGYYGRFIIRKISDQSDIKRFIMFTADGRLQYSVNDGTIYESHLSQPYIRKYIGNDKYIIAIPDKYAVDSETGIVYNLSDIMDAVLTVNGTIKAPIIDEILLRLAAIENAIASKP